MSSNVQYITVIPSATRYNIISIGKYRNDAADAAIRRIPRQRADQCPGRTVIKVKRPNINSSGSIIQSVDNNNVSIWQRHRPTTKQPTTNRSENIDLRRIWSKDVLLSVVETPIHF